MRGAVPTRIVAMTIMTGCITALSVSGCALGSRAITLTPTLVPTNTATPTATPAFVVGVSTSAPTATRPSATPSPTLFVAPAGPYVSLTRHSGPVVGGVITVRGGNLPSSQQVAIVWSPRGRGAGISTTTYTDKHGAFTQRYDVPAAQPGAYQISVVAAGVAYATSNFQVVSAATIRVSVTPNPQGDRILVTGTRFEARSHLLVVAYRFAKRARPIVLGHARADDAGVLRYRIIRRLPPGEYTLHVFSTDALTADMADTYFQVEV